LDYTTAIVVIVSAIFYYRAGVYEKSWAWLWTALSVAVSVGVMIGLRGGALAILGGQLALFIGITVFRVWRAPESRPPPDDENRTQ
jgi:hypothetical protein